MKMFFKILVGSVVLSSSLFAQGREEAVNAAVNLADSALELSQKAYHECGCTNTGRVLGEIAELAADLEIAARFGTRAESKKELAKIVRKVRELKPYMAHISNPRIRVAIKRGIFIAVNEAGQAVMPGDWIMVRTVLGGDPEAILDNQIEAVLNFESQLN